MRGERQSLHLQEMMQRHQRHPEYELALSPVAVKKKSLKKMEAGDVLVLGWEKLDLCLLKEGRICANLAIESSGKTVKLKIYDGSEKPTNTNDSKKYEYIFTHLEKVQSRSLERGHKIEIPLLQTKALTLYVKGKAIATGDLVTAEDKMAIQITKVNYE